MVAELALEAGVEVRPAALDVHALLGADEVFVTNSVMGVMPVCRVERKSIGDDEPGPVTISLMNAYSQVAKNL